MAGFELKLLSGAATGQEEAIDLAQEGAAWSEAFQLVKGVADIAATELEKQKKKEKNIQNMIDSHNARQEAEVFNQEQLNKTGTEQRGAYESKLKEITDGLQAGNLSVGWYQGYMAAVEPHYSKALVQQQTEFNNEVGVVAGGQYVAGLSSGVAGDATIFISNISETTGVPAATIRDGVLNAVYADYNNKMNNADTFEELQAVQQEFNTVKAGYLSGPQLLGSRSKELKALVTEANKQTTNTYNNKIKEFKYKASGVLAAAEGNSANSLQQYVVPYEGEVDRANGILNADNPRARAAYETEYKKQYDTHAEERAFHAEQSVFEAPDVNKVKRNSALNKSWPKRIQQMMDLSISNSNYSQAIKIANAQATFLGETGNSMFATFEALDDPVLLGEFLTKHRDFHNTPGGIAAHHNMYSAEQNKRIILTDIILNSPAAHGDPLKAKELVTEAINAPIKAKFPKMVDRLQEKRRMQLGYAYNDYLSALTVINNSPTADVEQAEAKLFEYYEGRTKEEGDLVIDTKYGNMPDSINPDALSDKTQLVMEAANYSPDDFYIKVMPDGTAVIKDKVFSTHMADINLHEINKEVEREAMEPVGPLERRLRAGGEHIISAGAAIQEAATLALESPEVKVTTVDGKKVTTVDGRTGLGAVEQLLTAGTGDLSMKVMAGLFYRFFHTIEDKEAIESINNPIDVEDKNGSKAFQSAIVGDTSKLITQLREREGESSFVYVDTLGNPTAGIGHLLTKEEQRQYPVGTKIPKEQIDKWLEEDSKEALSAAKIQASMLGITNNDFVDALGAVNFQLGPYWPLEHKTLWEHLQEGNYTQAGREAAKSEWNKQTPTRVKDFQKALKNL
jgi:GH24 family phage-related lysozyme (muramidase)